MKTFLQWAESEKLELPVVEDTKRGGIAHWAYPTAYTQRGVGYPDAYFMPSAADAMFKMKSKPKDKAPPDDAP
jgi:hypothetical protein